MDVNQSWWRIFNFSAKFHLKISQLFLESHDLEALFEFYAGTLGMPAALHDDQLLIRTAETQLHFKKSDEKRLYHFAFNIPLNKIDSCHRWLKERASILPFEGEEIIHHVNWNSKAIYAFDSSQNIIEFIARPSSMEVDGEDFDPTEDVLNVSEIGMVVNSIPEVRELVKKAGIERFSEADEYFSAFGSEEGLFIAMDRQKDFWLPTDIKPEAFPFEAIIENDKNQYRASFDSSLTLKGL